MDPGGSSGHRDISEIAPELRRTLLAWWEVHGRKDIAIKPWMFTVDGRWPEQHEDLSPYGIWIAEVMRCSVAKIFSLISKGGFPP